MRPLLSFGPTPNAVSWSDYIEVLDDETGTGWNLTDVLVEMEVVDADGCRRLYGSTTGGELTLVADGFEFSFPRASMKALCAGSYTVNIRFTDNATGDDAEPVIANLPIIEGGYR